MGKLIWLASYPKSGNTWLRAFLHNYLRDPATPHDINRLLDLTATENDAGLYRAFDPRPASAYTEADVQRMRPLVHRKLMESFPDYVFVKTHNARTDRHGRSLITPDATAAAIYVVRDPRDIAISYGRHLDRPLDQIIATMANPLAATGGDDHHVYEHLGSWSDHVMSWTGTADPRVLVLRYEDMHGDATDAFGRVIRFLGAEPDADRLGKAIAFSRFDSLQAQETAAGFIEKPPLADCFFRHGKPGEWRSVLSAPQAFRLARAHAGQMARLGYR